MPIYPWTELNTGKEFEVIRDFPEYEQPPTREEAVSLTDEEFAQARWERQIALSKWIRNYPGGKGYWAIFLALGSLWCR